MFINREVFRLIEKTIFEIMTLFNRFIFDEHDEKKTSRLKLMIESRLSTTSYVV